MATFVLNANIGTFGLSNAALERLGLNPDERFLPLETCARSNPELVRICKELGAAASIDNILFSFVDVPEDDLPYVRLDDYGWESLTIDEQAKTIGTQTKIIAAIRAVMATHLSDAEKLSVITTFLK